MKVQAVLDRIEGTMAVLLVGAEEVPVSFPAVMLPSQREGAVFDIDITEQPQEESARRSDVEALLAKLRQKGR